MLAALSVMLVVKVGAVSNTNLPVPVAPVEVTPSTVWWPVNVLAASVRAIVAEVLGKVITVESVPDSVKVLVTDRVFRFVMVNVPVEVVMVRLLIEVAVATPRAGLVRVGLVSVLLVKVCVAVSVTTVSVVPGKVMVVESVPENARLLFTVKVLPFTIVSVEPVAGVVIVTLLMVVAEATPRTGVTSVGEPSKTNLPVPVAPVLVMPSMV